MSNKTNDLYDFGDFRIDRNEKVLYKSGKLIQLAPKVFDTLMLLVENNGKIISKDDLMNSIWEDSFVEEGNLTQNIYSLRQVFGKRNKFIKTIPRRGYRFSADVQLVTSERQLPAKLAVTNSALDPQNGLSEIVISRKSTTTYLEEEVTENDDGSLIDAPGIESKLLPGARIETACLRSRKFRIGLTIGAVATFVIGALAVAVWQRNLIVSPKSLLEKVRYENLTDTGDVRNFAISPNGQFLALAKGDDSVRSSIWLRDVNSKQDVKLALGDQFDPQFLEFSPDGNSIYFLNRRESVKGAEIHRTSRFGGNTEFVLGDVWSDFSISPNGGQIAFYRQNSGTNRFQLIVCDIANKSERVIATKDFPDGFFMRSSPAWSSDAKTIFAITQPQSRPLSKLVGYSLDTGKETLIHTPQIRQFTSLAVLPNGNGIIVAAREKNKFAQVYKFGTSGENFQRLTNDLSNYRRVTLSSDGKYLATLKVTNYSHIWTMSKSQTGDAVQLTHGNTNRDGKHGIDVLPNGKIVFTSLEGYNRNLWLVDPRDRSKQQLTKDLSEVNERPYSAADGVSVYFSTLTEKTYDINRINYITGKIENITTSKDSNDIFPNISADGKTLYFIRQKKGVTTIIQRNMDDQNELTIAIPKGFSPDSFLTLSPDENFLAFREADREKRDEIEENASNPVTIGIVAVSGDQSKARKITVTTSQSQFRWNEEGTGIYFIRHVGNDSTIEMKEVFGDPESKTELILSLKDTRIFHFKFTSDDSLVLSQGKATNDAVLISNF